MLGIQIGGSLHLDCNDLLLSDEHRAHLQQLISLLAGKLIGVAKCL